MPVTESQGSFLGRMSIRRNQVMSMEGNHEQEEELLDLFQKHVADRFSDLLPASESAGDSASESFLSIAWLRKLLDAFICSDAEFKAVLLTGRDVSQLTKPPADRLILDLLDRAVKALDVCNAVSHGVDSIRQWQRLAEIATDALEHRPIVEGHVRRAKRSLVSLLASVAQDDKESNPSKSTERSWSLGRRGGGSGIGKDRSAGCLKSNSWSVTKTWSASKQIQAMSGNLLAPRGAEMTGISVPVYAMSTILVLVMWALVASLPCQERSGLAAHIAIPRNLSWAQPIIALQERMAEEWKKKEKRCSAGLVEEVQMLDKISQSLVELLDSWQFPMEEERMQEMAEQVADLSGICQRMAEGLTPLQQQIREVFHRIVRSRTEVFDVLDQGNKLSPAPLI